MSMYLVEQLRPDLNEPLFALRGPDRVTVTYLTPEELYALAKSAVDSWHRYTNLKRSALVSSDEMDGANV